MDRKTAIPVELVLFDCASSLGKIYGMIHGDKQ